MAAAAVAAAAAAKRKELEDEQRRQAEAEAAVALARKEEEELRRIKSRTPPPKTPPGGHSLKFNKARAVESHLHDPLRDFLTAGGDLRATGKPGPGWAPGKPLNRLNAALQTGNISANDPAFTDDTVRGVLNFLLRSRYYEESPAYGVNPVTVKGPGHPKLQTMWGDDTDTIPPPPTPPSVAPTPPRKRTPLAKLSRPQTSDMMKAPGTTGFPNTPQPFLVSFKCRGMHLFVATPTSQHVLLPLCPYFLRSVCLSVFLSLCLVSCVFSRIKHDRHEIGCHIGSRYSLSLAEQWNIGMWLMRRQCTMIAKAKLNVAKMSWCPQNAICPEGHS